MRGFQQLCSWGLKVLAERSNSWRQNMSWGERYNLRIKVIGCLGSWHVVLSPTPLLPCVQLKHFELWRRQHSLAAVNEYNMCGLKEWSPFYKVLLETKLVCCFSEVIGITKPSLILLQHFSYCVYMNMCGCMWPATLQCQLNIRDLSTVWVTVLILWDEKHLIQLGFISHTHPFTFIRFSSRGSCSFILRPDLHDNQAPPKGKKNNICLLYYI